MKKKYMILGGIGCILVLAMVTPYLYVSLSSKNVISNILRSSLNNYGEFDARYEGIISEYHYSQLCFRVQPSKRGYEEEGVVERYDWTISIDVHDSEHVSAIIYYGYKLTDRNGKVITSITSGKIEVEMIKKDSGWVIVSVHEIFP